MIGSVPIFEVICIAFAFFLGLAVRQAGWLPWAGFQPAGFAINAFGHGLDLPEWLGFNPVRMHRDALLTDLGNARILFLGMGRTGTVAYDHLTPSPDRCD